MQLTRRIKIFNIFRNCFRIFRLESFLAVLTKNKGFDNFFVKCLPQNYQFPKGSFRIAERNSIKYHLDLSEYMEWVIYFDLNVEHRKSLFSLVKEGMVIFDIGTNIGETFLNFAKLSGPGGIVFGFEPVDENYQKCVHNISLNSFNNIRVNNIALSDKEEVLYFKHADNLNSGGIYMNRNREDNNYSVNATTLDAFVMDKNILKIDLIKIDVEGFETNVIKGAMNAIKQFKPILFIEVNDYNLRRQGSSSNELLELIRSGNYVITKAQSPDGSENISNHFDIICRPFS